MNHLYFSLTVLHWLSAVLILLEGLNKMEQCNLLKSDRTLTQKVSFWAKAAAWMAITLACAGVAIAPLLRGINSPEFSDVWVVPMPSLSECSLFIGFATLIVRSWIVSMWNYRRYRTFDKRIAMLQALENPPCRDCDASPLTAAKASEAAAAQTGVALLRKEPAEAMPSACKGQS